MYNNDPFDYKDFHRNEEGELVRMEKSPKKPMVEPRRKPGDGYTLEEKEYAWDLLQTRMEDLDYGEWKRIMEAKFPERTDIKFADWSILRSYFKYGERGLKGWKDGETFTTIKDAVEGNES
jgi:hypothetical protein